MKLVKTDTLPKCRNCQGLDFVKSGQGWACFKCLTFVWPELTNDIKSKRGVYGSNHIAKQ